MLLGGSARIQYIPRKRQRHFLLGVLVVGFLVASRGFSCASGHLRSDRPALVFVCSAWAGRPCGRAWCRDAGSLVSRRVVTAGCLLVGQGRRWVATVIRWWRAWLGGRVLSGVGRRLSCGSCRLDGAGRRIAGPARGAAPHEKSPGARRQLIRDARTGVLDAAVQHLEIRRPATRLPLPDLPQPLGVPTLQTPHTTARLRTPKLFTTRRIIAGPAPIPHPRELGPGEQFQLPHATNYPEPNPRSHPHIHDRKYQFCDQRHSTTIADTRCPKGAITCRRERVRHIRGLSQRNIGNASEPLDSAEGTKQGQGGDRARRQSVTWPEADAVVHADTSSADLTEPAGRPTPPPGRNPPSSATAPWGSGGSAPGANMTRGPGPRFLRTRGCAPRGRGRFRTCDPSLVRRVLSH